MADKKKKAGEKESTVLAALLVDIKAVPVQDRKIVNGRTIDLVKLDDVVKAVEDSF